MKKTFKLLVMLCAALIAVFAVTACGDDEKTEHTHSAVKVEARAATCTADGNKEYYTCSGCDEVFSDKDCTKKTTVEEQKIPAAHIPAEDDGDCTTAVLCTECDKNAIEAKESHTPAEDDGDCTTEVLCTICGKVATEAKESHTLAEDDGDCTTEVLCTECGKVATEAKESHTPAEDDGDCTTEVLCTICGKVATEAKESHTPAEDDGDCTTAVLCTECGKVATEAKESHTPAEDDGDCTTAVLCTECDKVVTEAKNEHTDTNLDGSCDSCEHKFDYVHDEESGTYIVFTADGLYTWAEDNWESLNLKLGKDIVMPTEMKFDLDGDGINDSNWDPQESSGTIDGNGYSIKGLVMKSNKDGGPGSFISDLYLGGVIKNLRVLDADMSFVGINYAILVGYNDGLIENCGVSGKLYVEGNNVAGIVGTNSGKIIACYNDAEITATLGAVGGIVGQNISGYDIIACYNTGAIISEGSSIGGISGSFYGGSIIASYSTSSVSGDSRTGAIAGYGDSDGILVSNYWSTSGETPEYGVGNGKSNENIEKVDGEAITWSDAMTAMNAALENGEYEWRYALNTGDDAAVRPLIISAVQ